MCLIGRCLYLDQRMLPIKPYWRRMERGNQVERHQIVSTKLHTNSRPQECKNCLHLEQRYSCWGASMSRRLHKARCSAVQQTVRAVTLNAALPQSDQFQIQNFYVTFKLCDSTEHCVVVFCVLTSVLRLSKQSSD